MKSDLPKPLQRYLSRYVWRKRVAALVHATGRAFSVCVIVGLAAMVLDQSWWISAHHREQLRILPIGLACAVFTLSILHECLRKRDPLSTASLIERKIPALEERLLTVVSQYALPVRQRGSGDLLRASADEVEEILQKNRPSKIAPAFRSFGAFLPGLLLLLLAYGAYRKPQMRGELMLARFLDPRGDHELPVQRVELSVKPGSAEVALGKQLRVVANVRGSTSRVPELVIEYPPRVLPMAATGDGFAVDVTPIDHDLDYSVRLGDLTTPTYHVHLLAAPSVTRVQVHYDYPAALKIASRDDDGNKIESLVGTTVTLTIQCSQDIAKGRIELSGHAIELAATPNAAIKTARFVLEKSGTCTIEIENRDGLPAPVVDIPVVAVPDQPPTVTLLEPVADVRALPFDVIKLKAIASDDLGLDSVMFRIDRGGKMSDLPAKLEDPQVEIDLAALGAAPGETLALQAVAKDRAGQIAVSESRKITVDTKGVIKDELTAARGRLEGSLRELVSTVKRLEVDTNSQQANVDCAQVAELCGNLRLAINAMSAEFHQAEALNQLRSLHWTIARVEKLATSAQGASLTSGNLDQVKTPAKEMESDLANIGKQSWATLAMDDAARWKSEAMNANSSSLFADQLVLAAAHEQASSDGQPHRVADLLALSRAVAGMASEKKVPADFIAQLDAAVHDRLSAEARKSIIEWGKIVNPNTKEIEARKIAENPPAIMKQIDQMITTKAPPANIQANATRVNLMQRVEKAKVEAKLARSYLQAMTQQVRETRGFMDQTLLAQKQLREASADEYIDAYNNVLEKKTAERASAAKLNDLAKSFKAEPIGLSEYARSCDATSPAMVEIAKLGAAVDVAATDAGAKKAIQTIAAAEAEVATLQDRLREVDPLAAGIGELSAENDLATEDLSRAKVREMHAAMVAQMDQHQDHVAKPETAKSSAPGYDDAVRAYFEALAKITPGVAKQQ